MFALHPFSVPLLHPSQRTDTHLVPIEEWDLLIL
jgi:hypothetical protein